MAERTRGSDRARVRRGVCAALWPVVLAASAGAAPAEDDALPALIPRPATVVRAAGSLALNADTALVAEAEAGPVAEHLAALLRLRTGLALPITIEAPPGGCIMLQLSPQDVALGEEGYVLAVDADRVELRAAGLPGLFYAVQTLRQLLREPPEGGGGPTEGPPAWHIPCVRIEDRPRFGWRGFMLDSARTPQSRQFLLSFIETLASYKINRLHWNLSADNWRLPLRGHPDLATFYSADDIRAVVNQARSHFITIYPELEMPGHSWGVLDAMPDLRCDPTVRCGEYCLGNDDAIRFLEEAILEAIGLFDAPYVHLGGDEAGSGHWARCPKCQARKRELGLADEIALYKWFMRRMARFVAEHGRVSVAWGEHVERGVPEGQIVQGWRGESAYACTHGHRTINSNCGQVYFDYPIAAGDLPQPVPDWMPYSPLSNTYAFEPVPAAVTVEQAGLVLGAEACLWTESVPEPKVYSKVFPRLLAFAEVVWSPAGARNWHEFLLRAQAQCRRLKERGIESFETAELTGLRRIGSWGPAEVPAEAGDAGQWDVTSCLSGAGIYEVVFLPDADTSGPVAESVALLLDGAEVDADLHGQGAPGGGGGEVFSVSVGDWRPDGRYVVRARFRDRARRDSAGRVLLSRTGYVAGDWLILGTFPNPDTGSGTGFDREYIGEQSVSPFAGDWVDGRRWRRCFVREGAAAIDLLQQRLEPAAYAVAYAFTRVRSPIDQEVDLLVGSDDGCKVWVNGREVLNTGDVRRAYAAGSERCPVSLRAGWNGVLVKVTQYAGGWMFSARFDAAAERGLTFDAAGSAGEPGGRRGSDAP